MTKKKLNIMTTKKSNQELEQEIINVLKEVYDPELPVNIYELGLIYEIKIDDNKKAQVLMTLTAPNCPVAESLPVEVKEKVATVEGISEVEVELTFEPPWDKSMMSEAALLELGFL